MAGGPSGRLLAVLVLLLGALQLAFAQTCPNRCSGHGACGTEGVCICETGWTLSPDCSEQV
jgi:hypothetical protein